MSWNDIPRWQAMSKEELFDEVKSQYGDDPLLEQTRWIYIRMKDYALAASVSQEKPKGYYDILWRK